MKEWNRHPRLKASARPSQEEVLPRDPKQNAIRWWATLRDEHKGTSDDVSLFVDMVLLVMRATPTEVTCETMFSRHDVLNMAKRRGMKVENLIKLIDAWAFPQSMVDVDVNDPRFADLIPFLHQTR